MISIGHVVLGLAVAAAGWPAFAQRIAPRPGPAVSPFGPGRITSPLIALDRSKLRRPTLVERRQGVPAADIAAIRIAPVPWLATAVQQGNDMSGWTPLTAGATNGGASIVSLSDRAQIVVRGADDMLYSASFDPANPGGPIDGAAWRSLEARSTTEPNCTYNHDDRSEYGCAWRGPGGNVFYGFDVGGEFWRYDMAGKGPGAPILAFMRETAYAAYDVPLKIRGSTIYYRTGADVAQRGQLIATYVPLSPTTPPPPTGMAHGDNVLYESGWVTLPAKFDSTPGCTATLCVFAADGRIGASRSNNTLISASSPVPGGTSRSAPGIADLGAGRYAVVVRSATGTAYRSMWDGGGHWSPWQSEGGTLSPGAAVSCIAHGAQPLCVAQGLDGRIYWKKLSASAGS